MTDMRGLTLSTLALSAGLLVLQAEPDMAAPEPAHPTGAVVRFLDSPDTPLRTYRALRTLKAATRGGRLHAEMTACTWIDPSVGFQYFILTEAGSELIRNKVLRQALEAERTIRSSGEGKGALTPANYEFLAPDGPDDDGLIRVGLRPLRREPILIEGKMLLTEDADLVRVEGALSKRPSFWTRSVQVVRSYRRLEGVRVPVSMESTARVLIVGSSTFAMTYEYESINGLAVPHTGPAAECRTSAPATHRDERAAPKIVNDATVQ